jgi:signal transduction histidine kinase
MKQNKWKPKPVKVHIVYRTYAITVGLLGTLLLLRGPVWFPPGAMQARLFGSLAVAAACCAAALSFLQNVRTRNQSLFWFASAHVAAWLVLLALGLRNVGDEMVSLSAGTAFLLFCMWLTAEGEFPCEPWAILPPDSASSEPLRSQYEQKIRQAAAQEERNRLARDLHDSIKQQIFAIQTAAATAQLRIEGDSSGAREALEQIRSSAREAMTEMEVMLDQLRAEPLESTGLVAALKKLCESIGFRTGAQVEFKLGTIPPAAVSAPGAAEATLRVAQEALANVARHARAAHVSVSLDSTDGRMHLTVTDDGSGFDPAGDSRGMGTANMRARAHELGGTLDLTSAPTTGTAVKFSIPYAARVPAASRTQYRNRAITIALWLPAIFFNKQLHHWSFAPALLFVAALAVIHYVKAPYGNPRSAG